MKMEVCVDSVQSAVNAKLAGASRIELCANLIEGGTTPSIGMLSLVKRNVGEDFPVFVMIRPRGGDFLYDDTEAAVMEADMMALSTAGADGFVFGALNEDGTVDSDICKKLISHAKPHRTTFHRAIDMSCNITVAMETVISLGFDYILTSGGESSVLEGAPVINKMIKRAGERITIVPGGGINDRNLARILTETGAREFHASARCTIPSHMQYQRAGLSMGASFSPPEFSNKAADLQKVKQLVDISQLGASNS